MRLSVSRQTAHVVEQQDAVGEPCPFAGRWEQAQGVMRRALSELQVFDGLDPPAMSVDGTRDDLRKAKGAVR